MHTHLSFVACLELGPAVSALDVVVARGASVFACSIAVLDRIVEDLGCDINGKSVANQSLILMREAVNRYRAERRAWGAEAADAFINVQLAPQ